MGNKEIGYQRVKGKTTTVRELQNEGWIMKGVAEDAIKVCLNLKLKFARRKIEGNCPVSKVKIVYQTMLSVSLYLSSQAAAYSQASR